MQKNRTTFLQDLSAMWRHYIRALPIVLVTMGLTAAVVLAAAGTTDSPDTPANTLSYTLEDIYNRLDSGDPGSQSAFTEPSVAPGTGTMVDLNTIMGIAPAADELNGATAADVLSGKTFWGLTSSEWGPQSGTLLNLNLNYTRVPKTGQTGCWDEFGTTISCAGTGQDGEYQLGVLPEQVPNPGTTTGAYTVYGWTGTRFTDNGDGTVSDNLTGLVWLKDANCAGASTYWLRALSYSNALFDGCTNCFGTTGDCGLSDGSSAGDWRLPNANELHSLIDLTQNDPALPPGHPFTGVQISGFYWSSTTTGPGGYSFAILTWMGDGSVVSGLKDLPSRWVWPVRSGN
jgi:hypothetical protein